MYKTRYYDNGYYKGEVNDSGKRHGEGTYYWKNNERFSGKWSEDSAVKGTYYFNNGNKYVGEVYDDGKTIQITGKGTTYFKSGAIYVGRHTNCMEDGKGTLYYTDGVVYKGEFSNGHYFGNGKLTYLDGHYFVGFFKEENNTLIIRGKKVLVNGSYYEGNFHNGLLEGNGKHFNSSKQLIYEGEFKNNKRHGVGKYYYLDGTTYQGSWENSKKHGNGVLKHIDGSTFKGTWINDIAEGKFTITNYLSNEKYSAIYKNGAIVEKTRVSKIKTNIETQTLQLKNGNIYEGQVFDGKPYGAGIYYDKSYNGDFRYEGNFINGKFTGYGSHIENKAKYVGEFKNFMRHGKGVQFYSDGKSEAYGQWKNDELHGRCALYNFYPGIAYIEGVYKRGRFVGKVQVEYDDGTFYIGKLKDNQPNGKGIICYPNDSYVIGKFKKGKLTGEAIMVEDRKMYECLYKNGKWIRKRETNVLINKNI